MLSRWRARPVALLTTAAMLIAFGMAPQPAAAQTEFREFTDLEKHWSESFVRNLLYSGVLTVPEDGRFRPDEPVTRLDFTLWIAGAMELTAVDPNTPPFGDWDRIPEAERGKVAAAVEAGLINGFPDGTFRPQERLTRAEMGVIFGRALEPLGFAPDERYRHVFVDGHTIPEWAAIATAAIKAKVILGMPRGGQIVYGPFEQTTRAEVATMIVRFVDVRIATLGIERPRPTTLRPTGPLRLAYYINQDDAFGSLTRFGGDIDGVIYWSYHLNGPDGSVAGSDSPRTMSWAAESGKPLIALITAHDRATNDAFLADVEARQRFVGEMLALVDKGYSGVNLDFEYVSADRRGAFTELVREVARALRARGQHVSLSVPAKTREMLDSDWVGAYDYAALAAEVDYIALMTYDQHYAGGPAGPVGSLSWMRSVLDYAVSQIPREKILLGIPGYGYDWPVQGGRGRAITGRRALELAMAAGGSTYDPAAAEASFRYVDDEGISRIVYFTPGEGVAAKTGLVGEYRLGGFVMWRLGQEHDGYWEAWRQSR